MIGDPASAGRIIRAIVNSDGFSLSVFNPNPTATELPDLESTDILYPEDPYFIFGFDYMYEIGPRRLPPRPRDYRPHPRPPHSSPPVGRPIFDHDTHWSRPGSVPAGRPDRTNQNIGRSRTGDRPRQDQNASGPRPVPPQAGPLPETASPGTSGKDRPTRPPGPSPRPRLNPSPMPNGQPADANPPHSGNHPSQPPGSVPPKSPGQPHPEKNPNGQSTPVSPRTNAPAATRPPTPAKPRSPDHPARSAPAPHPVETAKPAPPPPAKDRPVEDNDRHEAQR